MLLAVVASFAWASAERGFDEADALIEAYKFLPDVSFSVGTAAGRVHTLEKGNVTMSTPILLASSSKFPAAIAIAGAVQEGHLSFDTPARSVFDWWTGEPRDRRANVTLRHLLTFTSGLVSLADAGSVGIPCLNTSSASNASKLRAEDCARQIYDASHLWLAEAPGRNWSYHSLHLQVAGAMAAKAAGLSVPALLQKFLLRKAGMNASNWIGNDLATGPPNPHLAATLVSTGDDYDRLLRSVLAYEVINENAMCIFVECVNQEWSERCARQAIHADPGAFGYWPVINRKQGYYLQLVLMRQVNPSAEVIRKYNVTPAMIAALPAQCVSPLRNKLGPPVERALGVHSVAPPDYPLPYPLNELCKIST